MLPLFFSEWDHRKGRIKKKRNVTYNHPTLYLILSLSTCADMFSFLPSLSRCRPG